MSNLCIDNIEKRFASKKTQTYIVDVHSCSEMNEILSHFAVGGVKIISASDYCKNDELPRIDNLYDVVSRKAENIIVTELSSFLRFNGDKELRIQLSTILGLQTSGVVVFLTFCCKDFLRFPDLRVKERIYVSDNPCDPLPKLIFADVNLPCPPNGKKCNGIHSVASVIETEKIDPLYVTTQKRSMAFPASMYSISNLGSAYDVLCQKDATTHNFDNSLGSEKQWAYALSLFESNSCWQEVVSSVFGSYKNLEYGISNYADFDEEKKWLYYLSLKMFGVSSSPYLSLAIKSSNSHDNFVNKLFREILEIDCSDVSFKKMYVERKTILKYFVNYVDEIDDYCKMVKSKSENAIYYLSDLTELEKECVFEYLDKYGTRFELTKLLDILSIVYADLYYYLSPYHISNSFLENYFQRYKYQKVINKVFPDFIEIVEQQGEKRDYLLMLEPRTAKFDSIDKSESQLYFMDAMGVEYLSFILAKCNQKGMEAKVTLCYSELPSLTCFNKEFVKTYEDLNLPIVSIKDIDEIKHHGKYDYNYMQSKLPLHLIKELSVIEETLDRIRTKLAKEVCQKIIMVSDHGASRLAVINEKENQWEMSIKGEHSGRCCPKTDIESRPDCATEERDYWVLANYDRFRGGRKANVEVHGGATLEEITVPIIEISTKKTDVEINIVETVITVSFRKKASITLFSKTKLHNVSVLVEDKFYDAVETDDNFYKVEMPDIKKKGDYKLDVYSSGNLLVSGLTFTVIKEGTQENKLF